MRPAQPMSVSELKNRLLEIVRRVEQGETFEITKGGEAVALLSPRHAELRSATGFGRVAVKGALELPAGEWTYDVANLKPRKRRK